MKVLPLFVLSGLLQAAPAAANLTHETALAYEGATLSVTYELRTRMTLRQLGLGPRGTAACRWIAEVSVERRVAGASRTVEGLTRVVGEPMIAEGSQPGHCTHLSRNQAAVLDRISGRMQAHLAEAAAHDEPRLRAEMASFAALDGPVPN